MTLLSRSLALVLFTLFFGDSVLRAQVYLQLPLERSFDSFSAHSGPLENSTFHEYFNMESPGLALNCVGINGDGSPLWEYWSASMSISATPAEDWWIWDGNTGEWTTAGAMDNWRPISGDASEPRLKKFFIPPSHRNGALQVVQSNLNGQYVSAPLTVVGVELYVVADEFENPGTDSNHGLGSAYVDVTRPFWVVDMATSPPSWSQKDATNLTGPWQSSVAQLPHVPVTFYLESSMAGQRFTVHSRGFTGAEQMQSVIAARLTVPVETLDPEGLPISLAAGAASSFTVNIPRDFEVWVTRDTNVYPPGSVGEFHAPLTLYPEISDFQWTLFGKFQQPKREAVKIYVAEYLASEGLQVQQAGGVFPLVRSAEVQILPDYTWDGYENSFWYREYTGEILATDGSLGDQTFWVIEASGTPMSENGNQTWFYGEWTWQGGSPQNPLELGLMVRLPASRSGRSMTLVHGWNGSIEVYTQGEPYPSWMIDPWHGEDWLGSETLISLEIPDWWDLSGGLTLYDDSSGDNVSVSLGENDLRNWFLAPEERAFHVSLTRWNHTLRIRDRAGREFPLTYVSTQGGVVWDDYEDAFFSSDFNFSAVGHVGVDGIDWWVADLTTGEESPWNTFELQGWIAVQPAWGVEVTLNVDEQTLLPDGTTLVKWAGPGGAVSFDVERGINGSWVSLGNVEAGTNPGQYSITDVFPVPGRTNQYRIVTRFTDRRSAPSGVAEIVVPAITDPLAGIPLYEQDGSDNLFVGTAVLRNPWIPARGLGVTKMPGGATPAALDRSGKLPPPVPVETWSLERYTFVPDEDYPDILDEDPSRVNIKFLGTDLQTGVIIERREPGRIWEEIASCAGIENTYTDQVQVGAVYYYRLRAVNAAGVSEPTRMIRWIPGLYLRSPTVYSESQVHDSEGEPFSSIKIPDPNDPPLPPGEIQDANNVIIEYREEGAYEGDSISILRDFPGRERARNRTLGTSDILLTFPTVHADHEFLYDALLDSGHDYTAKSKAFARNSTVLGTRSAGGGPATLSALRVRTVDGVEHWEGITKLELTNEEKGVELDVKLNARIDLRRAPALIGSDSFTAGTQVGQDGPVEMQWYCDQRQSQDWGHELFFEQDGPANQVEIAIERLTKINTGAKQIVLLGDASKFDVIAHYFDTDPHTGVEFEAAAAIGIGGGPWNPTFQRLTVVPHTDGSQRANVGDTITIRVEFSPPGTGILDSEVKIYDEIKVTYVANSRGGESWEFAADEASGPRYRRVDLAGRAQSDLSPEGKSENDFPLFGAYVDALTLQLHHEVSDISLSVPGSSLSLGVTRRLKSHIWNTVRDLPPERQMFQPFGPAWSSSLGMHMKIVAAPGQQTFAYITDYAGAPHRFLYAGAAWGLSSDGKYHPWTTHPDGTKTWGTPLTPWIALPSGNHESAVDGESLVETTFRTKHGMRIEFELIQGLECIVVGASGAGTPEFHAYLRPKWIEDNVGNRLIFEYGAASHPMPQRVYSVNNPELELIIQYGANNRVRKIWDPKGHVIEYFYGSIPGMNTTGLIKVLASSRQVARYEYEAALESDRRPLAPGQAPSEYGHCNVRTIEDGVGNRYNFTYACDTSKTAFHSGAGLYLQSGLPRLISTSVVPTGHTARFANLSQVTLARTGLNRDRAQISGVRRTEVTDLSGRVTRYDFLESEAHVVDPLLWIGTPARRQVIPPIITLYKVMEITHPLNLKERVEFNLEASLAVGKVRDIAGKETSYGYRELAGLGRFDRLGQVCPTLSTWAKYHDDPTFVEDPLGAREYFAYNSYRQRIGTIDKTRIAIATDNWTESRPAEKRSWKVDASAGVLASAANVGNLRAYLDFSGTPASQNGTQTTYQYSEIHKGVVTKETVKLHGEPLPWPAGDLVTERVLDESGNVFQNIVGGELLAEMLYDRNGNCIASMDGRGFRTSFIYDHRGRLTHTYYPSPDASTLHYRERTYDENGNVKMERDENGNIRTFAYNFWNNLVTEWISGETPATISHIYDSAGVLIQTTDGRGTATKRTYDTLRRLRTVTEAFGQAEARTTTYEYPASLAGTDTGVPAGQRGNGFQPTKVIDPRGFITRNFYDSLHRLTKTSIAYQTPGQDPVSSGTIVATTQTEYDSAGRVVAVIDPLNKRTETSYDNLGRPEVTTYADLKTVQNFYTSTGLKWKFKDEAGKFSETYYDATGRVTAELAPNLPDGSRPKSEYTYDEAGNLEQKHIHVTADLDPSIATWTYRYDGRNRKIAEIGPPVETGRQVTRWAYDGVGNVVGIEDARGKTTNKVYNSRNWLRFVTSPAVKNVEGATARPVTETRYDANGNVLRVIDAEGRHTVNTYDRLNRLKTTTDHAGILVTNGYDASDNRISLKDGKNQITTFTYDGLKRLLTDQPPFGPPRIHAYDACNRVSYNDGNGIADLFFYDERHRLKRTRLKSVVDRHFSYDAAGRLDGVDDPQEGADVGYQYDGAGRLISETSAGVTHSHEYDLAGNRVRTNLGHPAGGVSRIIESTYDLAGRLKEMRERDPAHAPSAARVTSYFYDGNGNVIGKALPNGVVEQATFDALNRRRFQTIKDGATTLTTHEQFYDRTGNVRVIVERVENDPLKDRRLELEYDGANRLIWEKTRKASGTQWTDDGAVRYEYDAANNRTWKRRYAAGVMLPPPGQVGTPAESWQSSYNSLNQLTSYQHWNEGNPGAPTLYFYDDAGNRTWRESAEDVDIYYYDLDGRLDWLERWTPDWMETTQNAHFIYDYRARRVSRVFRDDPGADPPYAKISYVGGTSVTEFTDRNEVEMVAEYIRGSDWGGGVGGLLYSLRPGLGVPEPRYTHYNGRGDVVLQTDQAGDKQYEAAYEAFGTRTRESGSTQDRQRANTKEEETEFGILNEGFRYRDLETGIWLTRDPAGFVDGPNLYAYVRQNPWSKFDPHGLSEKRVDPDGFQWLGDGHHTVPAQVARDTGWAPEAKAVFDRKSARISTPGGHGSLAHGKITGYNAEVSAEMAEFFATKRIPGPAAVPHQEQVKLAEEFVEYIAKTDNKFIMGFNGAAPGGRAAIREWLEKEGNHIILKSTGKTAMAKTVTVTTGMAKSARVGNKLVRGIPIVGGLIGVAATRAEGLAEGKTEDQIATDVAMSVTGAEVAQWALENNPITKAGTEIVEGYNAKLKKAERDFPITAGD